MLEVINELKNLELNDQDKLLLTGDWNCNSDMANEIVEALFFDNLNKIEFGPTHNTSEIDHMFYNGTFMNIEK